MKKTLLAAMLCSMNLLAHPKLSTNPALSLPCGKDEADMPFGLQKMVLLHRDAQLLRTAV